MSELPEGWTSCRLKDAIEEIQAGFASGKKDVEGGLSHLRMNNISVDGKLNLELLRTVPQSLASHSHYLKHGDVLICTTNSGKLVGKCALFDLEGHFAFSNHLTRLRVNPNTIESKYLLHQLWLLWKKGDFEHKCKHWVNQSTLPKEELLSSEILLAPLNEQRRIVAKLEKMLSRVDAAQTRLAAIPRILNQFRQSVLATACSGRLTADWRGDCKHEEANDLPPGWERVELETLLPRNGIFDGPFGSNLKTSDYTRSGIRVIRLENIGHLRFIGEKETYISNEKYETLIKHTVQEGDIIFASFIADEIRACPLPHLNTKAIAKADCFCLRPKSNLVDRTYLTFQLVSQESFSALIDNIHGATRPRINTTQLRRLLVRICPLGEQQEIVRRVEELFKTANALEARYRAAKAHVDKLTQSILAKAFRGELVPQDPNDEPASVLLDCVRNERVVSSKDRNRANANRS